MKSYVVRRYLGTSSTAVATVTVSASTRGYTATGLTKGTGYSFTVTAVNSSGPGRTAERTSVVKPT